MRSRKWNPTNRFIACVSLAGAILCCANPADARPWNEHTNRLMTLSRQMENGEQEIHTLILEKRRTYDAKKVADILRQIEEKHKAIRKAWKDYEEERQHVRFEHPEKNDQLDKTYVRHELRSLEDLESDLGIDARLDRVKARVLAKFPIPEKKIADVKKFRTRLPASKDTIPAEDQPEKITLSK